MKSTSNFDLEEIITVLSKTPVVLESWLVHLPHRFIHNHEGENTWSPFDIVGHLIHGEKTDWIPRAKIILSGLENKAFTPFDRFAQFEESQGKNIIQLLSQFKTLRHQNLDILSTWRLDDKKLAMKGLHPDLGMVSLQELLSTWMVHDLSHIHQMARVMARNYQSEVGPWKAYISIMSENR